MFLPIEVKDEKDGTPMLFVIPWISIEPFLRSDMYLVANNIWLNKRVIGMVSSVFHLQMSVFHFTVAL